MGCSLLKGDLVPSIESCVYETLEVVRVEGQRHSGPMCGVLPDNTYHIPKTPVRVEYRALRRVKKSATFTMIFHLVKRKTVATFRHFTKVSSAPFETSSLIRITRDPMTLWLTADVFCTISVHMKKRNRMGAASMINIYDGPFKIPSVLERHKLTNPIRFTSTSFHLLVDIGVVNTHFQFTLVYTFNEMKELPEPEMMHNDLSSHMRLKFDRLSCKPGLIISSIVCIRQLAVPAGSYMRMTFHDLRNPGFFTQRCEYSGFAVVAPERVRYIGEIDREHMDHSMPVINLCHSGQRADGRPFPDTYTSFSSSVLLIYYAFLQNPHQVKSVRESFSLSVTVEQTECRGLFFRCMNKFPLGCVAIPPSSTCSGCSSCQGFPYRIFQIGDDTSIRVNSYVGFAKYNLYTKTKALWGIDAGATLLQVAIETNMHCIDIQHIPSTEYGERCFLFLITGGEEMIQGTSFRIGNDRIRWVNGIPCVPPGRSLFNNRQGISEIEGNCVHLVTNIRLACDRFFTNEGLFAFNLFLTKQVVRMQMESSKSSIECFNLY